MGKQTTTAANAALMNAIQTLLEDEEDQVALPMTQLNQYIAQLSLDSSKTITSIGNKIIKSIAMQNVANENDIDALGTAILAPLYDWQAQNNLLLTQLSAGVGLTQPGDPLESALLNQTAEAPELAYSATLLLALREAMGRFDGLVEVLREIRDRMPGLPMSVRGETRESGPTISEPAPAQYEWVDQ